MLVCYAFLFPSSWCRSSCFLLSVLSSDYAAYSPLFRMLMLIRRRGKENRPNHLLFFSQNCGQRCTEGLLKASLTAPHSAGQDQSDVEVRKNKPPRRRALRAAAEEIHHRHGRSLVRQYLGLLPGDLESCARSKSRQDHLPFRRVY